MSYTSHGHHIPGSVRSKVEPTKLIRCGGPTICEICTRESTWFFSNRENSRGEKTPRTFQEQAMVIAVRYHSEHFEGIDIDDVAIVWFSKTLLNWKALVTVIPPSGHYYEVTYDGNQHQTYLDVYTKVDNMAITDEVVEDWLRG